ncbi:CDP-glycerol glycerophosphotransferase family protein [candidate division CSSED10-310 bacterium]|uniref:CDP-glycerol glycerophosphotransferase family protein n=1 Tax=candidate division CSSED10-310 bacterium TaxID=2855610 RepID=A0ABV6YRQ5_UNCC1
MNPKQNPVVLYYPCGLVHFRNLKILQTCVPDLKFLVIVEAGILEKTPEIVADVPVEDRILVENGCLPPDLWQKSVSLLFLSMAYPTPFRLGMVYEAARRNIPVMAIEEVNQLALNDGIINHYFMPLDFFGVASAVERDQFIALGLPGQRLEVTGWPFFDQTALVQTEQEHEIRAHYGLPRDKKCCLLILGALKENDMVSLETQRVRDAILEQVSKGLPEKYQLLIKPHPIETDVALRLIRDRVPAAVIIDPKLPIEPLLTLSDLIVNRGNSQVALLAMMLKKPLIIIPVELRTIFHGVLDVIISNSISDFSEIVTKYDQGKQIDYENILKIHFPLTQNQARQRVRDLFHTALNTAYPLNNVKQLYLSLLFAFLDENAWAEKVIDELPDQSKAILLKKLYRRKINYPEFQALLEQFPEKMISWHLQALYIRTLMNCYDKKLLSQALELLTDFSGLVNPHYFIDDVIAKIDLEYRAGRLEAAQQLVAKFQPEYSVYTFYHQAFDMLRFVHQPPSRHPGFRRVVWLLLNLNKSYFRRYLRNKWRALTPFHGTR